MKKHLSIIFLITFLFISCKTEKKAPEGPTQMEEVMVIHDAVMAKMGKLGKLTGELKS